MNLSMKWLADFVDISGVSARDFSSDMTMSGSKVEGYESTCEGISGVVVGRVLSVEKHPDADKLSVCSVDIGAKTIQVVTAATNMKPQDLVPVCTDGATLPDGTKIKKGKLRGVESDGMFCSFETLGCTHNDFPYADPDGILVIKENCRPGDDICKALMLDDISVEFEITPNRSDCLSVIGLAIETGATYSKPVCVKEPNLKGGAGSTADVIAVKNEAPDLCARYTARAVKNVKVEPSPLWLRMRLRASGVRPINNIVDITNYVMLEYGQPMHAFDREFLKEGTIVVRRAADGEKITTLDETDHLLTRENLVICDAARPVAVAGVMGGLNSEITDHTSTVIFESANFNPVSVRRTAKQLGLRTESSSRFEKGLDPNITKKAVDRACELVEQLGCGIVCDDTVDVYSSAKPEVKIEFDPAWINSFLGTDISEGEMIRILESLRFKIEGGFVTAPSFRLDVESKADIAEEVARIYGYNNIPTTLFRGETTTGGFTLRQQFEKDAAEALVSCGCYEITTMPFLGPKTYDMLNLAKTSELRNSVKISNPFGEDTSLLRTTPLISMLEALSTNYAYRNKSANLFEIAKGFIPSGDANALPEERRYVVLGSYGNGDFYDIKGILTAFFDKLSIKNVCYAPLCTLEYMHPGRTAEITCGERILGYVGQVHPSVLANFGIKTDCYAALLLFDACFESVAAAKKYKPLPRFPASSRDLALLCDEEITVSKIEEVFKKHGKKLLENIELFDIYRGNQIPEGKKSIAYSLSLRADDRTLTDDEIDRIVSRIIKELYEKYNISLR